jgi:RNA polymerase I-specific transcription initiation factor RRN6
VALGRAVYVDHKPGYRTDPIIAIPGGEAGHVLRLIRPHVESCAWGKKSSVKLSLLDAASSSIGYWVGNGGPIYQITFAGEYNESSELLAVRQASEITIFRPMYHRQPIPAVVPSGYAKQYPSSRLSVNPVTVLTADKCGSKRHADVSFNPFYSRQFGTVDDRAYGISRGHCAMTLLWNSSQGKADIFSIILILPQLQRIYAMPMAGIVSYGSLMLALLSSVVDGTLLYLT